MLVMPAYRHAAHRVFNALDIDYTGSGAATTTRAANPLGHYTVRESRLAYRRIVASGVTRGQRQEVVVPGRLPPRVRLHGELADHGHAVARRTARPTSTRTSSLRFKASERGAAAVINPRYVIKNFDV